MASYEERLKEAKIIYQRGLSNVRNNPEPNGQKFHVGDRVFIGEMPINMSHFPSKKFATVKYTYAHAYGGSDNKSYCLDVDDIGQISWYKESQLSYKMTTK